MNRTIRQARHRANLTIREASEQISVGVSTLSMYERAQRTVPRDIRCRMAVVYRAPEVMFETDEPLNPVWLGEAGDLLEAIGWLSEEASEALDTLEYQERSVRHGHVSVREVEQHASQVYDLWTALGHYFAALTRETDVSIERIHDQHLEKVKRYRKCTEQRSAA